MISRVDLKDWVLAAVDSAGGEASVVDVAKYVWANHEDDLRRSGDLFFTWQYDVRWAATALRREGKLMLPDATKLWKKA